MSRLPRIRSDLAVVHNPDAPFEKAFLIGDRVTNRYWQVSPLQYEMARVFREGDWATACKTLRSRFEEPVSDAEIDAAYAQFEQLGLVELSEHTRFTLTSYRRALRVLGVKSARIDDPVVRDFVERAELGGVAARGLVKRALELRRTHPGDETVTKIIDAFHRALNTDRVAKENAHVPVAIRWMRVQVSLFDPNAQLSRWLPRVSFLFSWWFFLACFAITLAGFNTYLGHAREVHQRLVLVSNNLTLLFTCTVIMLVVHEYAHAFACRRYGGEVHDIGLIIFLFFIPAAYCDVSDAHLFPSRRAKLIVAFAGTWSTYVLASFGALVWANTIPTSLVNHIGLVLMATGYATVLTNLNPLLPLDGYFLLSDWLGVENLRDRAPDYAKAWLAARLTGNTPPTVTPREHRIFFTYFVFGSVYQVFYLLLSLGLGWLMFVRGGNVFGLLLFAALVYLFYVRTYWLKIVQLWREARTKQLFAYMATGLAAVSVLVFVPFTNTVSLPVVVQHAGYGFALEGELPERHVALVLDRQTIEAYVGGAQVIADSLVIDTRPPRDGERPRPKVRVGIVAPEDFPQTLTVGSPGQLVLGSGRSVSLWRRLWGAEWDKVVVDVWRLL